MILPLIAALAGALAVFVAIGSLTGQFSYSQRRLAARAVTFQRQTFDQPGARVRASAILKEDDLAGNEAVSTILRRFSWAASRAKLLDGANLPLKVSEYLLILVATFGVLAVLATVLSKLWPVGLGFGIAGVIFMELWVKSRASRRLQAFDRQLPTALQAMSVSLKSGFGIMESVATVAREMDPPLSTEFERIIDEARLGGSFEAGLAAMVERVDSPDLRIVSRAIEIHRKVGGDLGSILESVAGTMRERDELRGHIRALTAQQRLSGIVISLLPLWAVGFFSVTAPDFISPLWEETTGRILLATGIGAEVLAFFLMRRFMAIEV
jgi:tight adherence protein B